MLTSREATEAPRQGSRSPLSPTEVTESATVRLFLILSALLCSVNNVDLIKFLVVNVLRYVLAHVKHVKNRYHKGTLKWQD